MVEEQFLVPLEDYLKVGLHIGTKFRNKYMESFIYKVRPDGLAVLNIQEINKRIDLASGAMSKYKPEEILVVCRRENGWKAAELFSKMTGIRVINGRYPPGILTNSQLENFIEIKLMVVVDPWPDRNAIRDAIKVGVPIIALCDTNNEANYVDLVVPCNNKGKKSLGLVFWILAREYLKRTGMIKADKDFKGKMDEFIVE